MGLRGLLEGEVGELEADQVGDALAEGEFAVDVDVARRVDDITVKLVGEAGGLCLETWGGRQGSTRRSA